MINLTLEEKGEKIIQDIEKETGVSPVRIFKNMAKKDYISMHGPEHHVLDGAILLLYIPIIAKRMKNEA